MHILAFLYLFLFIFTARAAEEPPFVDISDKSGAAGLGFAIRTERSMYRDGGTRFDFVPVYLYEGKTWFLHAYRFGLKLDETTEHLFSVFLAHRFEGFPYDRIPLSLAGMEDRGQGIDLGIGYQQRASLGTLFGEVLHDVSSESSGTEARLGIRLDWEFGRLSLRPQIALSLRNGKLNNYYYGIRPAEATASRAAHDPGPGINAEFSLRAAYRLTKRWRTFGEVTAVRWPASVRTSPIVQDRTQLGAIVGLAYDFSPEQGAWSSERPLIVKLNYGKSTDCDLAKTMLLRCTSTHTVDQTRIESLEIGRPFVQRLNGWPVDFVGYLGLLRHNERGLQLDSWQLNAYIKGFYYGFPWSDRVRTRLGFGAGLSYADRVPYVEQRDQIARGRNSSRVLNYLDPSVDISVGDVIGVKSMRETYFGFGVSHRSGIFGTSQLLGNVNGGSNYIYTYVEWAM